MMARIFPLLCNAALLCALTTPAFASLELADKSTCLNCHQVDKKMVGPAFADIAAKYKDRVDATAYLTEKIVKGSTGAWGAVPMPANAQIKADDAKALSTWIMALPPKK